MQRVEYGDGVLGWSKNSRLWEGKDDSGSRVGLKGNRVLCPSLSADGLW